MARSRVNLPGELKGLLAGDWERVLGQAMLGREDRQIMRMYVMDRLPQIEIAAEIHMDRSTISRRLVHGINEARRTAKRMNIE